MLHLRAVPLVRPAFTLSSYFLGGGPGQSIQRTSGHRGGAVEPWDPIIILPCLLHSLSRAESEAFNILTV